ncbi:MAG: HAMP domain-containing histidine kinase [Cryobacterium sp.]|nr:HAMP domain-containing histidine kinase [Oligoflexia bacterium]
MNGKKQSPPSAQHIYDRLKALYGTGKLLASFENIEDTFPKILSLCVGTFPFFTAVLIRRKLRTVTTSAWHVERTEPKRTGLAILRAKEAFIYLAESSAGEASALRDEVISARKIEGSFAPDEKAARGQDHYFSLPLAVDHLPAFGVLQFEGSQTLDEGDLEFVSALAGLFSIGIDRFHKMQMERMLRENEAEESLMKLSSVEAHVTNLEAERELREKFVALLTHDLRTPLSAIRLNAHMIQLRGEENPGIIPKLSARIISSVDRADRMITDLLDANRIRSGEELPLDVEHFDLSELVRKTVEELRILHGDRFKYENPVSIAGYWDPRGIRRILENLCNNAVKYGSPESAIDIQVARNPGGVELTVHNWGNPISHEDQKFLFQQFRRSRKAEVGGKKGWGIGLTLVLGETEAHGGTVQLESELETGTTFTVQFPIDARPRD